MSLADHPISPSWPGWPRRLRITLEASDPGWLRLTQSLKTVLAVLLTMGILYAIPPADLFLARLGAGFLMQCGEGINRRRQRITFLICGLAAIGLASLGALASSSRELRELLVIVVAFLTFYLRRFIPHRPGFTAYGFVLCLLATVFPGGSERAVSHAEVMAIAFLVAFAVFFRVRPPNPFDAFDVGTRIFCSGVAGFLRSIATNPLGERTGRSEHLVKRATIQPGPGR